MERGEIIAFLPFSWVLHEIGFESLNITPARCFPLKCQGKTRKKRKNTACLVVSLALAYRRDRLYNFSCMSVMLKNGRLCIFSALSIIWWVKAFRDQQCQFLTRNKSLSSENEWNCSITAECVRTDSILPRQLSTQIKSKAQLPIAIIQIWLTRHYLRFLVGLLISFWKVFSCCFSSPTTQGLKRKWNEAAPRKNLLQAFRSVVAVSRRNFRNCSAAGTRSCYLDCNNVNNLTITPWCCSSRSSRTWPLLIWQSFCHNSLPTVVQFWKNLYPVPAVKMSDIHKFLSTLCYPMEQLAITHPEQHITPQV